MGLTNPRAQLSCGLLQLLISPTANRKQNSDHPGVEWNGALIPTSGEYCPCCHSRMQQTSRRNGRVMNSWRSLTGARTCHCRSQRWWLM